MEKNDWQDQKNNNGSDFMKVVQDAINSGDYQQLNEQVRKTVSASVQEVYNMGGKLQNGIMEGMRQAGNGLQEGLKLTVRLVGLLKKSLEKSTFPSSVFGMLFRSIVVT